MQFAANLSMMFQEHAFLDRFAAAAAAGFRHVEFLFPYDWPADEIAVELRKHNLSQALFNLSPGYWDAGERGLACLEGREGDFLASVDQAIVYAEALGCRRLHAMAGLAPVDADSAMLRDTYVRNIASAASACREAGIDLLIEPINTVDMPGFFLADFAMACDVIAEIAHDNGPDKAPKLQFDIYHCAKIHDDVEAWIAKCRDVTAHYQIAGIPDRHEPDIGDLALNSILQTVADLTPDVIVGCEYRPRGKTEAGLGWLEKVRGSTV